MTETTPPATARSGRPSASRSAIATDLGWLATARSVRVPNVPSPLPSRMETVADWAFATARSGRPSALRSASATEEGSFPTSYERNGAENRGEARSEDVEASSRSMVANRTRMLTTAPAHGGMGKRGGIVGDSCLSDSSARAERVSISPVEKGSPGRSRGPRRFCRSLDQAPGFPEALYSEASWVRAFYPQSLRFPTTRWYRECEF